MNLSVTLSMLDLHPVAWMLALCVPMGVLLLALHALPNREADSGEIRVGNPLLQGNPVPAHVPPILQPLLHQTRTLSDADLRPLVTGLRHLPLHKTAALLRRCAQSTDPVLQLHAQSVMQEQQEKLQGDFRRLAAKSDRENPANLAHFLEAGLALLESPLTPVSEHAAIGARIQTSMQNSGEGLQHPRALYAASRCFLKLGSVPEARAMHARMVPGSPLAQHLGRILTHEGCIRAAAGSAHTASPALSA